ncbi:MAG: DUF1553 domain-containing protein, partial [Phycisphaerae bacterium]
YGVFASGKEPGPTEQPTLPDTDSPDRAAFNRELAARQAEIDKYKKAAFDKIVTANKAAAPIARYLLIAQDARKAGDNDLAKRADDNKLIRNVLRRWKTWLDQTTGGRDEFFAPWHALAKLSDAEFAAKAPEALKKLKLLKELAPLAESAPKSLAAVAAIYGTALESLLKDDKHPYTKNAAFPLTVAVDDVPTLFNRAERDALTGLNRKREALVATHPGAPARAMVINDLPAPVQPHIFKRGNAASPGAAVPRQFLQVIDGDARKPFADGSGRLELAQKIASKDNPLTARVMVNRVWAQHFGKGIVRTPSDFGVRGERPTNPELLDYLAVRFMNDNWSLKKLHKTIMLSATYRQTSTASADALAKDPDNRLFSRQNRQRLEFEALRDALLAATGQLDASVGGRPVDLLAQPFTKRRTIYGFIDRQNLPNMFRAFDFASPDQHAPLRFENTVPQQALFMMNSPFVVEQAKALAARTASQTDAEARIRTMYRQALSRDPNPDELALAKSFVTSEAAHEETLAVGPAWQYGYGTYDAKTQRVAKFAKFPHFDGSTWAGSAKRPDKALQFALLTANGGHAGRDADHAVIRRWTAQTDGQVTVTGTLAHPALAGDGVRGRIVSSRAGELASLTVHNNAAETRLESVAVKKGDTIDFVVDCRESDNTDSFAWAVTLKMRSIPEQAAGGDDTVEWNSQ